MIAAKRMYLWSKEYSAEVERGIKSYNAANKKASVWTRKLTDYEKNEKNKTSGAIPLALDGG